MQRPGIILIGAVVLVSACADVSREPMAPETLVDQAAMAAPTDASGDYAAIVDFSTVRLTPRGRNCQLVIDGMLVFSGTLEGTATGTTTALIFGPCSEVATTPPGTFRDVFTSELRFAGTVNGDSTAANVLYQGVTLVGGDIEGRLHFSNGVAGVLVVDAVVAQGGTYEGQLVVR